MVSDEEVIATLHDLARLGRRLLADRLCALCGCPVGDHCLCDLMPDCHGHGPLRLLS